MQRGSSRGTLEARVGSGSTSEEPIGCGETRKRGPLDFRPSEGVSGEEERRCF